MNFVFPSAFAFLATLSTMSFVGSCFGADRFPIVQTDITVAGGSLNYNWCDRDHFVLTIERRNYLVNAQNLERERIELLDEDGKALGGTAPGRASCAEGRALAGKSSKATEKMADPVRRISNIYVGPMSGGRASLLIEPTERMFAVNFKTKYILAKMPKVKTADGYRLVEQCATYHHADYKLLCLDIDDLVHRFFALDRFVIAPYSWNEVTSVRGEDNAIQQAKNKTPPVVYGKGGIVYGDHELRDLDLRLIARLTDDPVFKINRSDLSISPDENFAYVPCTKRAESNYDNEFYGVCRYRLDGKKNIWNRVFVEEKLKNTRGHVAEISVDRQGDVYFALPGSQAPNSGIWMFQASSGRVLQVTKSTVALGDRAPQVSPDGRYVLFSRGGKLNLMKDVERGPQ